MTETKAFVYKWTHLPTLMWYVGSRTKKGCHPEDGYICSSKIVKPMILANPEEWVRELIEVGEPKTMRQLEVEILELFDAKSDPRSFNQTNGHIKMSTQGVEMPKKTKDKIGKANSGRKFTEEQIAKRSGVNHQFYGKKRPEHAKAMSIMFAGDKNPAKRDDVREKMRQAALSQSAERSARAKGDLNPAKRPEVIAKIKAWRAAQVIPPKYRYDIYLSSGMVSANTINEMDAIIKPNKVSNIIGNLPPQMTSSVGFTYEIIRYGIRVIRTTMK
jgi:hypothetical protein